nr:hypothetical protein [Streptomyces sp. GESEQ-35]
MHDDGLRLLLDADLLGEHAVEGERVQVEDEQRARPQHARHAPESRQQLRFAGEVVEGLAERDRDIERAHLGKVAQIPHQELHPIRARLGGRDTDHLRRQVDARHPVSRGRHSQSGLSCPAPQVHQLTARRAMTVDQLLVETDPHVVIVCACQPVVDHGHTVVCPAHRVSAGRARPRGRLLAGGFRISW